VNYPCPYCSTTASRAHNLRKHLMGQRSYGGHEISLEAARHIIENIGSKSPANAPPLPPEAPSRQPIVSSATPLLNRGHWRSLELLGRTQAVHETLALYEQAIGHAVYLRPTAKGLTVMSLDPSTPAMVGVGSTGDCCIDTLPPPQSLVASAALFYRAKVSAMVRESAEERHVIARIRAALADGLALGGDLLFLHQEWRFSTSEKLDVLAFDSRTGQLVVIEAKSTRNAALHERDGKGRTASEQAASYAARLMTHSAECAPFFQGLALALGRIYRPDQNAARIDGSVLPRCELWWPGGSAPASNERAAPMPAAAEAIDPPQAAETSEVVLPHEVTDVTWVASDTPWQRELRRRQSRWREALGYPIGLHEGRLLGSRLAMPDAEDKLWNFLTPAIGELVRREYLANASASREHQKVYGHPRLFADLLSSQPLAFNLFGELALDLPKASTAARRLWPDRVERVTRVEFEWSPGRWNARYLGNGTAADVAIFHTTPSGGAGIIFVETKYHEDLRGKDYPIKPRYLEVALYAGAFQDHASLQRGSLQQLWFDHLLLLATRMADSLDSALFVVAYPEINERCSDAVIAYQAALDTSKPVTFEARTLEEIVAVLEEDPSANCARRFRERYLVPMDDARQYRQTTP
jgi:hypothetical protein